MNFPESHPNWMWLYFGIFATAGTILFTLVVWNWMKVLKLAKGNLLSANSDTHNLVAAIWAAVLAMFFSVPGWACLLVSQRKILKGIQSEKETGPE
jgi:hypothetical protein